eukprot:TRINITY_DN1375_c0_g1_i1.p2 TRINITY_DN1375_c0_g1~~TRINITY_DN1375_c0_g1_i1.p2  ORF type:complete len:158 (+),score=32.80 TRINITY_DN1375_c0_g1_i1:47-520(+)
MSRKKHGRDGEEADVIKFTGGDGVRTSMTIVKPVPKFLAKMKYSEPVPTLDDKKSMEDNCEDPDRDEVAESAMAEYLASTEKARLEHAEKRAAAAKAAMEKVQEEADEAAGIMRFRKPTGPAKMAAVGGAKSRGLVSATSAGTKAVKNPKLLSFDDE